MNEKIIEINGKLYIFNGKLSFESDKITLEYLDNKGELIKINDLRSHISYKYSEIGMVIEDELEIFFKSSLEKQIKEHIETSLNIPKNLKDFVT